MAAHIRDLIPLAAAALLLAGPASGQTQEETPRQTAPTPGEVAAQVQAGRSMTIHAPDGTTTTVGRTAGAVAVTGGTRIVVPANARVNTAPPEARVEFVDDLDDAPTDDVVYTDAGYWDTYYLDSPTVVEYESLIRAGRSPSYSVTTLHSPALFHRRTYSPYYGQPYSYHHDRYDERRYDQHYRPYSSRYGRGPYSSYDPLGGALHRDAMLRFHRASYPRNLDGRDRTDQRRDDGRRDFDRPRDGVRREADRGRGDRGRSGGARGENRGGDRPREGVRRDSGPRRENSGGDRGGNRGGRDGNGGDRGGGSRSSRSGAARSPK